MSFKSFFDAIGHELERLFGSKTLEQQILGVVSYAAPIVETIVGLTAGGPAEALVAGVVNTVQADFATVSAVVQQGTVAAGSSTVTVIQTALNSIGTNLSGLLQAAEVKNSTKAAQITTEVNGVLGEIKALLANLPSSAPVAPVASAPAKS
jgi:hypothetical protein